MIKSNIIDKAIEPFRYLKYKKFYILAAHDLVFIGLMFLISIVTESLSAKVVSISTALFASIASVILMASAYSVIKYNYYSLIKKKSSIWSIAWKHTLAFTVIAVFISLLGGLAYRGIPQLFTVSSVDTFKLITRYLTIVLIYLLFLNFQPYDKKVFKGIWNAIKNLFSKLTCKIVYVDLAYIISIYVIYNILAYLFRFMLLNIYSNIKVLNTIFDGFGLIAISVLIITLMAINKLIIFEISPKRLK